MIALAFELGLARQRQAEAREDADGLAALAGGEIGQTFQHKPAAGLFVAAGEFHRRGRVVLRITPLRPSGWPSAVQSRPGRR